MKKERIQKGRIQSWEKDFFSKGNAVCESRILSDTVYCRFRREDYEFPAPQVFTRSAYLAGGWTQLWIPVTELRKLKAQMKATARRKRTHG